MTHQNPQLIGVYMVCPTLLANIYDYLKTGLLTSRTKFKISMELPVHKSLKVVLFILLLTKQFQKTSLLTHLFLISSWGEIYVNTLLWEESRKWDCFDWKLPGLGKGVSYCRNCFHGIYHHTVYQVKDLSVDTAKNYFQRELIRRQSGTHGVHEKLQNLV